ncbi:MAG: hypothetical protein R3B69_03635 [Candidatus Paceibacterota bacterium]
MIAHAQATQVAQGFVDRLNEVILFPLITLLLTIALIVFLYGCFEFVVGAADESRRSQGKQHILWGVVGMLVMVSAYAILSIAASTFNIGVPG